MGKTWVSELPAKEVIPADIQVLIDEAKAAGKPTLAQYVADLKTAPTSSGKGLAANITNPLAKLDVAGIKADPMKAVKENPIMAVGSMAALIAIMWGLWRFVKGYMLGGGGGSQ